MIHLVKILIKIIASMVTVLGVWFLLITSLLMWDFKILDKHSEIMDIIWDEN